MAERKRPVRVASAKGVGVQLRAERAGSWTRSKREQFLSELAMSANVRASAAAVGMSEQGAYQLRRRCDEFRKAWRDALCEGYARLELMMLERAMFGTEKAQWHGGKEVGKIHEISERLGLSLLAQHRASVTRDMPQGEAAIDLDAAKQRVRVRFELIERRLSVQHDVD